MKIGPLSPLFFSALVTALTSFAGWASTIMAQEPPAEATENAGKIDSWCDGQLESLEQLYRHFHQHPELSFQEEQTAKRFAEELREVGAAVTTGVGGHGVVAILENGDGPTLMLRADFDALPVREQTNLVYASTVTTIGPGGSEVGVMHACGHDIHMTNLIGVARYLASHRDDWTGTLMMIGQPAEERGAGAKAMLEAGLFENHRRPDYALALHVDSNLETGAISFIGGFQQANVDNVDITVKGRGGHGAQPHATIDPIVQAAQLVIALQTIVSREIEPTEPAVITVGSIHGGSKHNVIGNSCHLQLTVRSYSPKVRAQLQEAIKRKADAIAAGSKAPAPDVQVSEGTPSLFNDEQLAAGLRPAFRSELGTDMVREASPSMGGEDFSRFGLAGVPILMFRLGTVNKLRLQRYETLQQNPPSLHSPLYYPDARESLRTGIRAMTAASLHLLQN